MPIAPDDVCVNKAAIMERALRRVREEFAADPELASWTHVDALTLNVERACQAAIDLAMRLVTRERLGAPQSSSDAFRLLQQGGLISEPIARSMVAMVGFRNVVIHEYQRVDLAILRAIAQTRWQDFVAYCDQLGLVIRI